MQCSDSFFDKITKKTSKIVVILFLCFLLVICWNVGNAYEKKAEPDSVDLSYAEEDIDAAFPYLALTELDTETEPNDAVEINLDDYEDEVLIDKGGNYILSGSLDGHITVDAMEQNIHLFLNNVSITSEGGPAVMVPDEGGDKLVITVMEGTENTISDNGDFRAYDEYEAAIEAACDITLNGTGNLTVNGYYKDAVRSRDIVKVLDGTYTIKCKRNGIMGNDGILVNGGIITVFSEKNGLKTSKKGSDGRGNLVVSGGEISIVAGRYAFVTTKADIYIYDCTVSDKSGASTYDCGGKKQIQEGCVR